MFCIIFWIDRHWRWHLICSLPNFKGYFYEKIYWDRELFRGIYWIMLIYYNIFILGSDLNRQDIDVRAYLYTSYYIFNPSRLNLN